MKPDRMDIPIIPKVFISYNHKDQEVALKIKDKLENAGIEVFIDIEAMSTGENITEFIKKCIKESGITLSLISANSLMSAWVAMETIWSSYDETLRGRYFMPCNIDNSFFKISFTDQTLDVIEEKTLEISDTIAYRLKKGRGIEDLTGEHTRLNRLRVELPSIIGRLKNSLCVSLIEGHFDSGVEKVIKDILGKNPDSAETVRVENQKITKPTTTPQKSLIEDKKTPVKKGSLTTKLDEPPAHETPERISDPVVSIKPDANPNFFYEIDLVIVEGGIFTMGSPENEVNRREDETEHLVKLSDFFMCKHAVTVGAFKLFVDETNYQTEAEKMDGSYVWKDKEWKKEKGINWRYGVSGKIREPAEFGHPVVHVSWNDALEYCCWLFSKTGYLFRLPTEAEWEFACRAGTTTPFNTGEYLTTDQSNYDGNSPYNNDKKGKYRETTVPVNDFQPNGLGLFNMHGNVWEWCIDWYGEKYYDECKAKGTIENPLGPQTGSEHVTRGGGWRSIPQRCRSAYRSHYPPEVSSDSLGFRLVLVSKIVPEPKGEASRKKNKKTT